MKSDLINPLSASESSSRRSSSLRRIHSLSLRGSVSLQRFVSISLLPLFAVLFTACGGARRGSDQGTLSAMNRLYYESTAIRLQPLQEGQRRALLKQLRGAYRGRTISRGGRTLAPAAFQALPLPALAALHAFSARHFYGAEVDTLVPLGGKRSLPVSLHIDLRGATQLSVGAEPMPAERPISRATLEERYGRLNLERRGDARWGPPARFALDQTLAALSDAERRLLTDLPFVRAPGRGKGRRAGEYIQQSCEAKIHIYNRAFRIRRSTFIGEPRAPKFTVAFVLVHELGHALHNLPVRRKWCHYREATRALQSRIQRFNRGRRRNQRVAQEIEKERRRLQGMEATLKRDDVGPVLRAYREAVAQHRAPTRYGETSLAEAFAEAFALARLDPNALQRINPDAARWFASGAHLRALGGGAE